ncbi:LarC family nickel insertion protein [uncultured Anaerococcus sp.]|uniref:LarC family nickel insertion protein n=1 Tax=uncultured Anaerococcus sp. TaxID=293428 RepID=UPI00288A40FC|nr:LarC family nickel insertion protein [uncultured Anaerococcus sp.]
MDLYFEMYSGIAGDMTIGALLDLGASKENLEAGIKSLGLSDYDLVFERVKKNGIDAYNFDVILAGHNHHHHHNHHHEHVHCHVHTLEDGHTHNHEHCHDHDHHDHGHDHCHCHEDGHSHSHEHSHGHIHSHVHRNLNDIKKIINSSDLNENIKKNALGIFDIIADAEAKAHGIPKSEVHFHEVGAIDSIIDIVGTCICLDDLGVENIYFSDLYEGFGYQMCAHGPMPIPVPAVANILADSDINLNFIGEEGEHITPTGAAIVKYFYKKAPESFKIKKIGLGAGNKDFEKSTNILRVIQIETCKKKQ